MIGEWIESISGSSAGTVLGPVLFVIFVKDIPKSISPKFADDAIAIAVGDSDQEVERKLQIAASELSSWSDEAGMLLNVPKIKVMNFSCGQKVQYNITLAGMIVENVSSHKSLGIVLDDNLSFELHIDSVSGKVNSALNKICVLIRGRRGIPVDIAIDLYKSLVRMHLEYSIPAWSTITGKQVDSLCRIQSKCLKRVLGVFESSSSNAVEVVANIVPFNLRMTELCTKEWVKIMSLSDDHKLKRLCLETGCDYREKEGTPLEYLNFVSKDLKEKLIEHNLTIQENIRLPSSIIQEQAIIEEVRIFDRALGNSKNRTNEQEEIARNQFKAFLETMTADSILAFTDGSVLGESSFGEGGCGIVTYTKTNGVEEKVSKKVGKLVDNVTCEVEGILTAMEMIERIHTRDNNTTEKRLIMTDCKSAIDILPGQDQIRKI